MKGRKPTKAESDWMKKVVELGCCVCRKHYGLFSEAEPHHVDGKTKEGAHFHVLPLCPSHHRLASPNGEWATRHSPGRKAGKFEFEQEYGTEQELLHYVNELVNG